MVMYRFLLAIIVLTWVPYSLHASEELTGGKLQPEVKITTKRNTSGQPVEHFTLTPQSIKFYQSGILCPDKIDTKKLDTLTVESKRLLFRPVTNDDLPTIVEHLLSKPKVMKMFGRGKTYSLEDYKKTGYIAKKAALFAQGNPFSVYMVYIKKEPAENTFCGRLTIGSGPTADSIEHARLIRADIHGSGYGTEMLYTACCMVKFFTNAGIPRGIGGKLVQYMHATAQVRNPASWKSMQKVGFQIVSTGYADYDQEKENERYTLRLLLAE